MRFFDPKLARKMDDTPQGFFSIYRSLFDLLCSDEQLHFESNNPGQSKHMPIYPSFGDSNTPYAPPPGATRKEREDGIWVKDFYAVWGEFVTEKRFDWLSAWDADRGTDRRVRRMMEKENKKLRDDHRKEYNDTVRSLATFVQHRDPRYHAYQRQRARTQAPATTRPGGLGTRGVPKAKTESESIHAQVAAERQKEREKVAQTYQAQSWQDVEEEVDFDDFHVTAEPKLAGNPILSNGETGEGETIDGQNLEEDEEYDSDLEDMEPSGFECVACNKTFQSERQWENHERSKKHRQAVWK